MALNPGVRLGPYEILAAIGAGGMGEVYKARDTRLDRSVAIKIVSETLATDRQFRERFDREARAISQLTHPHICTLYDVGEEQGMAFLVMEYLEGETLADRLKKGALPLDDALNVAIQIADALSTAHRHGIVHRDLKPGNVMLTKAGAKLLDFGLAKASGPAIADAGQSMLPTTPAGLTVQGTILGTVQYMAPEQIEGQEADGRTDIFAFGAVLYEMLTGTKAFTGASPASLISSIISSQPPKVSTVQTLAPAELDHLIARCLAKGPDNRWQSARDVVLELEWIRSTPFTNVAGRKPRSRWIIGRTVAAALVGVFVGGTAVWMNRPSSVVAPMVRLAVPLLDTASIVMYLNGAPLAIAPDGSRVAFIGHAGSGRLLYVRRMADLEGAPIPGTELAEQPFFSPDGDWIAFFTGDRLKKVSVTGGPISTICVLPSAVVWPRGGDWGPDGTIIFAMSSHGLYRVSANGGVPERIVAPDPKANEVSYDFPQILSDRGAILYTVYHAGPVQQPSIAVMAASGADHRTLLKESYYARYVAPDLLLGLGDNGLFTVHFDIVALKTVGRSSPVSGAYLRRERKFRRVRVGHTCLRTRIA